MKKVHVLYAALNVISTCVNIRTVVCVETIRDEQFAQGFDAVQEKDFHFEKTQEHYSSISETSFRDLDGSLNDDLGLGYSLALSSDGETLAVGVPDKTDNFVRVYRQKYGKWVQRGQQITGLGYTVSLSRNGKILAIGNSHDRSSDDKTQLYGEVRVFQFKAKKNQWDEIGKVEGGSSSSSFFGISESLSGNGRNISIGAAAHSGLDTSEISGLSNGGVRVYHRPFQNKTHSSDIYL